jgi:V/A-type H+-transporting ATPase subunit E
MELQINDLVTSIRKEGVDAAKAEAESILAEARK